MPDISMCNNRQCRASAHCYRFRAWPSERQSYAAFAPVVIEGQEICEYFSFLHAGDEVRSVADPKKCEIVA